MTPADPIREAREDRLLPWPQVREIVGLSRTTAWRLQKAGLFPLPVQVSVNRVAWRERDIEAWCADRAPRSSRSPFLRLPPQPGRVRARPSPQPELPVFDPPAVTPEPAQVADRPTPPPDPPARLQQERRSIRRRRAPVADGQIAFDF